MQKVALPRKTIHLHRLQHAPDPCGVPAPRRRSYNRTLPNKPLRNHTLPCTGAALLRPNLPSRIDSTALRFFCVTFSIEGEPPK